ncbi:DcaP family trimeric outer membrane transporter [Telmatospirillum sp.]|uniref:DcaP family trimeric outer membrane transporter n=1 Tax=Telmatospirillum sp. TaxID=2079197 RepID=UPI00283E7622|nr:DcaP family trimeric outer membrane transporter [Telmatospirillum sp.]MDR3436266.1 DcaP family trimeric outer membrane transporter [Telmatospirillum sp.]
MFYKTSLMVSAAALMVGVAGVANAADTDVQGKQIEELRNTVQTQQKQIDDLINLLKGVQEKQATAPTAATPGAAAPNTAAVTVPNPLPPPGVPAYFSDAGSFMIPGTKTMLKVGGFAKFDMSYDFGAGMGAAGAQSLGVNSAALATGKTGFALPGTQAAHQIGRFQENARTSRFIMQSATPTELGALKFYLEADFQGGGTGNTAASNSAPLRFRQGYGTLGGWTFGETYTLWTDRATLPGSLDLNAGAGIEGGIRTPVVQYRWDIDKAQKNQLYFALENPFNDYLSADTETFTTAATPQPTNNTTKLPDFTVKYANNSSLGRLFVTGLIRDLEAYDAGSINTAYALGNKKISVHDNTVGWGVNMGGKIYTGLGNPLNSVTLRVSGGEGIGRYWNAAGGYSAVIDNNGHLKTVPIAGYNVSYQHWFSNQWQSNVIWGQQHAWNPNALIGPVNTQGLQKNLSEFELNLVWFPYPWIQMGPAYFHATTDVVAPYSLTGVPGTTRTTSGTSASNDRIQFTTQVGF